MEKRKIKRKNENSITKSNGQIIKENLCTLFNLLNFTIAVLLFLVGAYSNMLFIAIIILNIVIGTAQELKAKKLVDDLSILNRPKVRVRRDGQEVEIDTDDVEKDDILVLESGNQICNDAVVTEGSMEVNESLLTGESDAVEKEPGALLYSGSSVVSGRAYAKVVHVGEENYATKLVDEVKKEKQVNSELLGSMRKVTKFTSVLIIPLGILLFLEAFGLRYAPVNEAVVSSAAALLGMLPKGLVLLISVSLATGVIRLAKMNILVQNIYSLETLAHVDVLCLDKTGTITDGRLRVRKIIPIKGRQAVAGKQNNQKTNQDYVYSFDEQERMQLMKSYLEASEDNNATFQALKEAFTELDKKEGTKNSAQKNKIAKNGFLKATSVISFSSKRKWGCVSFGKNGSLFVGAPERIFQRLSGEASESLDQELEKGYRLLAVGYIDCEWKDKEKLPGFIQPLYAVVLEDRIRHNAKQALEFFDRQGVDIKVISGDHVKTVSMIAKRAGLKRWKHAIDMSVIGENADYDSLCEEYAVFARVTPKQKQELVKALQRKGHQVAMTGDGVNDILALREADCSIAIADGSDASRQIAQVVLMDSDFTHLPEVVMEGRKVIHNVTRIASVFFIKTIYSVLVSVFCLLFNIGFPFIPIQITLIDACIEAYPSFLTIVESDTRRIRGRFLDTALRGASPFGITVTAMILAVSLLVPLPADQKQTVMYLVLIILSMTAVIKSCIPFNILRGFICVTMVIGTFGALIILPGLFEVCAMNLAMWVYLIIVSLGAMSVLIVVSQLGSAYLKETPSKGKIRYV